MINNIRLCLIYFVVGFFLSCHSYGHEADKNVLAVLSDFTFVGSGQAKFNDDGSIDTTYRIPHDENEQPKPQNPAQGVQYVFHHRVPIDDESLALQVFPDKLTKMGFSQIFSLSILICSTDLMLEGYFIHNKHHNNSCFKISSNG